MSDLCRFCPAYIECQSAVYEVAAYRRSLLNQRQALEEARDYADRAEIAGAFSILSGEVTADEHEADIRRRMLDSDLIQGHYAVNLSHIENELSNTASQADKLTSGLSGTETAIAACPGLRLGIVRELAFRAQTKREKRHLPLESPEESNDRQAEQRLVWLYRHGKCRSPIVVAAAMQAHTIICELSESV